MLGTTVAGLSRHLGPRILLVAIVVAGIVLPWRGPDKYAAGAVGRETTWTIAPSLKYDALCFLNVLTGDPYYLKYYAAEYEAFAPRLSVEGREALASLRRKLKDERGQIISAFLALYFSATDAETIPEMLAVVDASEEMRERLRETPFYSEEGWALYESVRPELRVTLRALDAAGFPAYWEETARPRAEARIDELRPQLPGYDVIGEVERLVDRRLASDEITVYMLVFAQPHGIRITGTRFLTDVAWPFRIVLRNASHEMLHPPYDLAKDTALAAALNLLRADPFLMERVEHHNPSFGYNSFEGFVEEDVVQALEQVINERLGVGLDPQRRWRDNDDGMHVLAVALYQVLQPDTFGPSTETLAEFLTRIIRDGRLGPGTVRGWYERFYPSAPSQ